MSSYPTDLLQAGEQLVGQRLTAMAERFTQDGDLGTTEWCDAFLATWRHPYVPAYYPSMDRPPVLCIDAEQHATWLEDVYSDQTLVTKVQPIPLSRAFRPATGWMYTNSSTLPSLVLRYNCALLCQRLGSEHVTSVDIDPELVDLAGERLAANGYTPTLAAVDGAEGFPAGAPYDRIIATCAARTIPPAWLKQAAPGAVILTDVHGLLGGPLIRLTMSRCHVA